MLTLLTLALTAFATDLEDNIHLFEHVENGSGGTDQHDYVYNIALDADGNTYAVGYLCDVDSHLRNGNLVIGGSKRQQINGEWRTLQVSGIVRPIDVRNDNTVLSQFVGNFCMKYVGDGDETSFSSQGWLARMFNRCRAH